MMKLNCSDVREWLRRDLDGAAEPSSEAVEHLERCNACAEEAERIRSLAAAARESLPRAAVPFDFTDRVMDAITEPVGDDALADAVRPRRSLALVVVALMVGLSLLVFWPRGERPGSGDSAEGSLAEEGAAAEAEMVVLLTEHGELVQAGNTYSLDGLSTLLAQQRPNRVLLRASGEAPWQHVQWFLIACAENKIWQTRLAVGRGHARDAFLPRDPGLPQDPGIRPVPREVPLRIRITAVGRNEVGERRGPTKKMVMVPSEVHYSYAAQADFASKRLDDVAGWIKAAKLASTRMKTRPVGEIKAARRVPFVAVFGILMRFQEAGIKDVRFYGTAIPSRDARRMASLPYPDGSWPGQRGVAPAQPVDVIEEEIVEEPIEEVVVDIDNDGDADILLAYADPLKGIKERILAIHTALAKGGDAERLAQLRADLDATKKRFDEIKRVVELRKEADALQQGLKAIENEVAAQNALERENARLKARIAQLEAKGQLKAATDAQAKVRARAALALGGIQLGEGVARAKAQLFAKQKAEVRALKRALKEHQAALAKQPGDPRLRAALAEARAKFASAVKSVQARRAYLDALITRYGAQLRDLSAKIRKQGPKQELLAELEAVRLQIARLYEPGGAATRVGRLDTGSSQAPPSKPLSSKQLIDLFTARANDIHTRFQKAWAAGDTEAANAEKERLDETRGLLNRAAALKEMESQREERKKKGEATAALDAKIAKELTALRGKAPAIPGVSQRRGRTARNSLRRPGAVGVIQAVKGSLVSISVGRNDRVQVGDVFHLRRGAAYVGRIRITKVYRNQAIGQFDVKFKGPAAPPRLRDIAAPEKAPGQIVGRAGLPVPGGRKVQGGVARAGVVKVVRANLVSISLGSNDGVRVGDAYQIRRGASYVGQVIITKVYNDQAVGQFDAKFKGPGAPPKAGDVAEARKEADAPFRR